MNRTRIVVSTNPPELSTPHFDDETTIVTARPVVPIAQARAVERSRMSRLIVIGLLAAGLSGAAGALGIDYYRDYRGNPRSAGASSQANQTQTNQPPASQPPPPASSSPESPANVATSESPLPEPNNTSPQTPAIVASQSDVLSVDKQKDAAVNPTNESSGANPSNSPGVEDKHGATSTDSSQLVRKRRVHPANERVEHSMPKAESASRKDRGAGRIKEIFEGPGPM